MISRRNYVIIIIIMGIVLLLFQFSQVMKDSQNDYYTNEYKSIETADNKAWQQKIITAGDDSDYEDDGYTLFLGETSTDIGSIVTQWTNYTKRDLMVTDTISQYAAKAYALPEFLIIDSTYVDFDTDLETLEEISDSGVPIVFCNLPDVSVIKDNKDLMQFLGIDQVKEEETTVEGIKLFSGFLLGGEEIYEPKKEEDIERQDMDLTMPWYVTAGGTKTYMVGIMEDYYGDYEYQNDFYPAIIWRNSFGNSQIFCVNGDYMSQTSGLGILSSMIYELSDYQIYPVVNAQNTLVLDFPVMANENDEEFQEIYSRSLDEFQANVAWPSLVSLAEKNNLKYTCFLAPKYNYSDEAEGKVDYYSTYLNLFNERSAEVGVSLEHAEGITLTDKLKVDEDYYDQLGMKYEFTSAFLDLKDEDELKAAVQNKYLKDVRTVACDEDISLPILSYLTEDITLQSLTSNTKNFTYSKDLMLKSIETVLGYDNAKLTMSDVIWPESDEDHWENIYNDMASSLSTYWHDFEAFDRTTLTESDARVRTFLNLSSSSEREGDEITLHVSGAEGADSYFILRTHGDAIAQITGGSYVEIEDNAYLITVTDETVKIDLKSTQTINN